MARQKGIIYVARESFITMLGDQQVTILEGITRVREGHQLLDGREHLFEPLEVQYDIEEMTAEPGAKRGTSKA